MKILSNIGLFVQIYLVFVRQPYFTAGVLTVFILWS